jgi:hypothetical protein
MKDAGVRFTPTTYVRSIDDHDVTLFDVHTGRERVVRVDAVILSTSRLPVAGLAQDLRGRVDQLFTIGDALAARGLAPAAYEGQKFARYIGEPDAPATVVAAYFQADPPEVLPSPADAPAKA